MSRTAIDKLLVKTAQGDIASFEQLYECTKRGVFAFLYTYLHNYADTEDAIQTVYLKVKTYAPSYRQGTNGRAWLLEIAKNQALNQIKKRKREIGLDDLGELSFTQPEFSGAVGVTEVMRRILSQEEQQIVTLHVLWNYKHREIAETLGCPVGTVTSKYKRAVAKLKKELKEEER